MSAPLSWVVISRADLGRQKNFVSRQFYFDWGKGRSPNPEMPAGKKTIGDTNEEAFESLPRMSTTRTPTLEPHCLRFGLAVGFLFRGRSVVFEVLHHLIEFRLHRLGFLALWGGLIELLSKRTHFIHLRRSCGGGAGRWDDIVPVIRSEHGGGQVFAIDEVGSLGICGPSVSDGNGLGHIGAAHADGVLVCDLRLGPYPLAVLSSDLKAL